MPASPPPAPPGRRPGGLALVLAGGVLLRALGYLAAGPLLAPSDDSLRYAHGGLVALFADPFAPSGYPILLAAVHLVWPAAAAVSVVQHLLGLLTVACLWFAGREVGLPPWLAAVPAGFVALSGDQWFFEQSLMTETLFTALVAAAVLALLHAEATARRPLVWVAAAGAAMAAGAVTRPAGFVAAAFCLLWMVGSGGRLALRARLAGAAVYTAAAAAVLAAYLIAAGGGQAGIGSYAGWTLYARVAPFADCSRFTPPPGTRGLCESRPAAARPGVYFYLFGAGASPGQTSPAEALFGSAPRGNAQLRRFAIRAIEAQPVDYLKTVAKDAVRYIDPTYGHHRPEAGIGPEFVYLGTSLAPYPAREQVERLYGYRVGAGPLRFPYESWLTLSRVPGLVWLAAVASTLAGLALGGPAGARRRLALIAGVAFAIAMTPILTVTYEYRYSVPAQGLALMAAVLGARLVAERLRAARRAP